MFTGRNRVAVVLTGVIACHNFKSTVVSTPPLRAVTNVRSDGIRAGALSSTRSGQALIDVGRAVVGLVPARCAFASVCIHVLSANAFVLAGSTATFVFVYIAVFAAVSSGAVTVVRVWGIKPSSACTSVLTWGRGALIYVNLAL